MRVGEGGRGFVGFLVFDHSLWRKFHLEVWDLRNMFLSFYYYYYLDRGILRRNVHF